MALKYMHPMSMFGNSFQSNKRTMGWGREENKPK